MANRQDSGSNAAHENQRPTSHNEDALPEMTGNVRGRGEASDDEEEFEDTDVDELEEEDIDEDNY